MAELSDKAEEFAGRAREAAGDLTGDDRLRAEGAADRTEAEVKQKVDDVKQAVTEKASEVADSAQRETWGKFPLVPKTAVLSTGVRHVAWRVAHRESDEDQDEE